MSTPNPASMVEFSRQPESIERSVNMIPDVSGADRFVAGLRPATAKVLARLDFWPLYRLVTVLLKAMFFLRPHDRSVAEIEALIVSVTRAIAERSGK